MRKQVQSKYNINQIDIIVKIYKIVYICSLEYKTYICVLCIWCMVNIQKYTYILRIFMYILRKYT